MQKSNQLQFVKLNLLLLLLNNAARATTTTTGDGASEESSSSSSSSSSAAGVANGTQVNFQQTLAATLAAAEEGSREKLLSRKRRYLLFPEGSSFQLVYDEIIGVVDYTNYLILGITVALAWELPSKPPSEQLADLRTRLEDGTLHLSRHDTVSNVKYSDARNATASSSPPSFGNPARTQSGHALPLPSATATAYRHFIPTFHAPMHPRHYYTSRVRNGDESDRVTGPSRQYAGFPQRGSDFHGEHAFRPRHGYNYDYSRTRNPFARWTTSENYAKYPWWNLQNRLSDSLGGRPRPAAPTTSEHNNSNTTTTSTTTTSTTSADTRARPGTQQGRQQQRSGNYQSTLARKHRIFPVFGKRSATAHKTSTPSSSRSSASSDTSSASLHSAATPPAAHQNHHRQRRNGIAGQQLSELDRIYIRHHRSSRQTLYEKIEGYLDKRGTHGQHCVLRALCETGQKSHEHAPTSFVGELMRAVFTLPEPVEQHEVAGEGAPHPADRLHRTQHRYDIANAHTGDCAARYQHCKDSLWLSEFVA